MPLRFDKPIVFYHTKNYTALPIFTVDTHPSGRFVTGSSDGVINMWKLRHNPLYPVYQQELAELDAKLQQVKALVMGENNSLQIESRLLELQQEREDLLIKCGPWYCVDFLGEFPHGLDKAQINTIRFSPNGQMFAVAGEHEMIQIWAYQGPGDLRRKDRAFGEEDDGLGLFNVETWQVIHEMKINNHTISLTWSSDSLSLYYCTSMGVTGCLAIDTMWTTADAAMNKSHAQNNNTNNKTAFQQNKELCPALVFSTMAENHVNGIDFPTIEPRGAKNPNIATLSEPYRLYDIKDVQEQQQNAIYNIQQQQQQGQKQTDLIMCDDDNNDNNNNNNTNIITDQIIPTPITVNTLSREQVNVIKNAVLNIVRQTVAMLEQYDVSTGAINQRNAEYTSVLAEHNLYDLYNPVLLSLFRLSYQNYCVMTQTPITNIDGLIVDGTKSSNFWSKTPVGYIRIENGLVGGGDDEQQQQQQQESSTQQNQQQQALDNDDNNNNRMADDITVGNINDENTTGATTTTATTTTPLEDIQYCEDSHLNYLLSCINIEAMVNRYIFDITNNNNLTSQHPKALTAANKAKKENGSSTTTSTTEDQEFQSFEVEIKRKNNTDDINTQQQQPKQQQEEQQTSISTDNNKNNNIVEKKKTGLLLQIDDEETDEEDDGWGRQQQTKTTDNNNNTMTDDVTLPTTTVAPPQQQQQQQQQQQSNPTRLQQQQQQKKIDPSSAIALPIEEQEGTMTTAQDDIPLPIAYPLSNMTQFLKTNMSNKLPIETPHTACLGISADPLGIYIVTIGAIPQDASTQGYNMVVYRRTQPQLINTQQLLDHNEDNNNTIDNNNNVNIITNNDNIPPLFELYKKVHTIEIPKGFNVSQQQATITYDDTDNNTYNNDNIELCNTNDIAKDNIEKRHFLIFPSSCENENNNTNNINDDDIQNDITTTTTAASQAATTTTTTIEQQDTTTTSTTTNTTTTGTQKWKLFASENPTMPYFHRRADWSPDGLLFACPGGTYPAAMTSSSSSTNTNNNNQMSDEPTTTSMTDNIEDNKDMDNDDDDVDDDDDDEETWDNHNQNQKYNNNKNINQQHTRNFNEGIMCTHIFSRDDLTKPILSLPIPQNEPSIICKFSPVPFIQKSVMIDLYNNILTKNQNDNDNEISLKNPLLNNSITTTGYYYLLAIGTPSHITIYRTDTFVPILEYHNPHNKFLTDCNWFADGLRLVFSSMDSHCSFLSLNEIIPNTTYIDENLEFQTLLIEQKEQQDQKEQQELNQNENNNNNNINFCHTKLYQNAKDDDYLIIDSLYPYIKIQKRYITQCGIILHGYFKYLYDFYIDNIKRIIIETTQRNILQYKIWLRLQNMSSINHQHYALTTVINDAYNLHSFILQDLIHYTYSNVIFKNKNVLKQIFFLPTFENEKENNNTFITSYDELITNLSLYDDYAGRALFGTYGVSVYDYEVASLQQTSDGNNNKQKPLLPPIGTFHGTGSFGSTLINDDNENNTNTTTIANSQTTSKASLFNIDDDILGTTTPKKTPLKRKQPTAVPTPAKDLNNNTPTTNGNIPGNNNNNTTTTIYLLPLQDARQVNDIIPSDKKTQCPYEAIKWLQEQFNTTNKMPTKRQFNGVLVGVEKKTTFYYDQVVELIRNKQDINNIKLIDYSNINNTNMASTSKPIINNNNNTNTTTTTSLQQQLAITNTPQTSSKIRNSGNIINALFGSAEKIDRIKSQHSQFDLDDDPFSLSATNNNTTSSTTTTNNNNIAYDNIAHHTTKRLRPNNWTGNEQVLSSQTGSTLDDPLEIE